MEWVIGIVAFLSGMAVMTAVFSFGGAAKSADEESERYAKFVEDQKRAWVSGYVSGYEDKGRNAHMRPMVRKAMNQRVPLVEMPEL